MIRLGPKQVRDELRLAQQQMKTKGVEVGIGAGLAIAGLLFLLLVVIAFVVLVVILFANIMPAWAAALVTAGIFLVIAAILALFGVGKIKAAMPLVPEDAMRGLRYDIQTLKEGRAFNPREYDRRRRREAKEAEQQKRREAQERRATHPPAPAVPYHELLRRTTARRTHLGQLRDDAMTKVGVDPQMPNKSGSFSVAGLFGRGETTQESGQTAAGYVPPRRVNTEDPYAETIEKGKEVLRERWPDLAVAGASSAVFAVLMRKILKK